MSFDDKDAVSPALAGKAMEHDERREQQRRTVLWPALLHVGDHKFDCQIRNFSMSGLKIKLDIPLKEGTHVRVEVPKKGLSIKLKAEIVWQADGLIGLCFQDKKERIKSVFGERASDMGFGADSARRGSGARVA